MSRKTKRNRHSKRHSKRHTKRYHKTHKRTHRKRRQISIVPGSKSVPIFIEPDKKISEIILVNIKQPSGNIIPGLRDYMKNM